MHVNIYKQAYVDFIKICCLFWAGLFPLFLSIHKWDCIAGKDKEKGFCSFKFLQMETDKFQSFKWVHHSWNMTTLH